MNREQVRTRDYWVRVTLSIPTFTPLGTCLSPTSKIGSWDDRDKTPSGFCEHSQIKLYWPETVSSLLPLPAQLCDSEKDFCPRKPRWFVVFNVNSAYEKP